MYGVCVCVWFISHPNGALYFGVQRKKEIEAKETISEFKLC